MKKTLLIIFSLFSLSLFGFDKNLYNRLNLTDKMNFKVFNDAMIGLSKITWDNLRYFVIIDYNKPSNEPRFFVIDLKKEKLLYHSYVTHGQNSGSLYAKKFSNTPNSYQSSLGFYVSDNKPYKGEFGISLRLFGLEDKFNSNAKLRNIVIHGAEYASEDYVKKVGFLGRTSGCPAIPLSISNEVVNLLAGKSVIYIAGDDERYQNESSFLKR